MISVAKPINPLSRKRSDWAAMLVVGLLAMLLYLRALGFAFFNDDPTGNFAWMETHSLWQLFTSSAGYGFYRPVGFALWKGLYWLFDGYQAPAFHALSLLVHGLNAAMVWWLALALNGRRPYAWAAALIFITFPFNYEAVAYEAALFHPLLVFWLLLTLIFYRFTRLTRSKWAAVLAHITLILGLFSHENGVFIPLALVGLDWLIWPPKKQWRDWVLRPFLPYFIAPTIFLGLWLAIPKAGEQAAPSINRLTGSLVPFLQTLVYPLLPLARLQANQTLPLVFLALIVLIVMGLLARWTKNGRLYLFALAWILFSVLPSALFLDPAYVYGSPRLGYLPAVGVALFWALPIPALARVPTSKLWTLATIWGLQIIYVLLIIWPPYPFISCQLDFYAQASHIVRQLAAASQATPPETELIFLNVPFYFSSYTAHPDGCPNPYPWTPVGAVVAPEYANLSDFVRINGGEARTTSGYTFPLFAPGWNTFGPEMPPDGLRTAVTNAQVFVFDLFSQNLFDVTAAWQTAPPTGPALATFGAALALRDTAVADTADQLTVTLDWQVLTPPATPLTIFVHVYDANGALIAQHDGPAARGFIPQALWQAGDLIRDEHAISLPPDLPAGTYTIAAGVYDPTSGERVTAVSAGTPLPNNVWTRELFVLPQENAKD